MIKLASITFIDDYSHSCAAAAYSDTLPHSEPAAPAIENLNHLHDHRTRDAADCDEAIKQEKTLNSKSSPHPTRLSTSRRRPYFSISATTSAHSTSRSKSRMHR